MSVYDKLPLNGVAPMRLYATALAAVCLVSAAPGQVSITESTPSPQQERRPAAGPLDVTTGTIRAEYQRVSIEPVDPTSTSPGTLLEPITIRPTPAPRPPRQARPVIRTSPGAPGSVPGAGFPGVPGIPGGFMPPGFPPGVSPGILPGGTGEQPIQQSIEAATQYPVSVPDEAPFLPVVETGVTSPTIERGGIALPLRPEMLQARRLDLDVPDVKQTTMSTGMQLYHYSSSELPRIDFRLLIDAGSRLDPADKVGLASLTARTLRAGGSGRLSGDELDRSLEQLGSDLDISSDRDYTGVRLFSLKENAQKSLDLLATVLQEPQFKAEKLDQQRGLVLEGLIREDDDPAEIARREFRKLIYGADNPLGRTPTSATLHSISRDDVAEFYSKYYRPASIRIGVSGDVTYEEARQMVEKAFGGWKLEPTEVPPPVPVDDARDTSGGVFIVRKPTAQSQIRIGHFGIPRHQPEQYAVAVLNNIYGQGGFSSRLMNVVRTQHGYAYGVGGGIQSDNPVGIFAAGAGSKAQTTAAAIRAILTVTRELLAGNFGEDEIETAKRDVIFSFFTSFDTPGEIIWNHMYYDFLGYPDGFLENYAENIRQVKAEDLQEAAKKYIWPDRLKILVVGQEPEFDAPLSEFGPVEEIELEHILPEMGNDTPPVGGSPN